MVVHLLLLLLSYRNEASAAQMKLFPQTLTVLRGDEARFTCSALTPQWTVMVWLLNGTTALTISKVHGVLHSSNPNITAQQVTAGSEGDGWMFVLKDTRRSNEGTVTCDLQGIESRSAVLFVQEGGAVTVTGDDGWALKGRSVVFDCRAEGWYPEPGLQWQLNDREVIQSESNVSSEESESGRLFTVSSRLVVAAVRSSRVSCLAAVSAMSTPVKSSVRLTVVAEVLQEGGECTVPVAVTSSLAALLLLLLLCSAVVLCCRRRRPDRPSGPEDMWFSRSVTEGRKVDDVTRARTNLGFSTDGPTDADYNDVVVEIRRKMESVYKVPDVVHSRTPSVHSEGHIQVCPSEENAMNIRRITTV
ncbi:immunoglobulin superfamily member 5 isoform X2 [Cynoglossus semilaevis]|uniref:immunoglobulin superfamily member 5 isoform X2 n=1 Tax=Cynoglossus semilaevis TaxID=244447 RepID=UPI000D631144|nr:immunoglobulin superfamily member 5-like isoform X2 [Cynoglossus semilaevis]